MVTNRQYLSEMTTERGWRFWGLSATAHGLLAVVLFYSPAKTYLLAKAQPQDRPPMRIRGEELSKFVDALRDQTAEHLRERVNLLREGQKRMAGNFNVMQRHVFANFEEQQKKTARARLEHYLKETRKRLMLLLEAGERAKHESQSATLLLSLIHI